MGYENEITVKVVEKTSDEILAQIRRECLTVGKVLKKTKDRDRFSDSRLMRVGSGKSSKSIQCACQCTPGVVMTHPTEGFEYLNVMDYEINWTCDDYWTIGDFREFVDKHDVDPEMPVMSQIMRAWVMPFKKLSYDGYVDLLALEVDEWEELMGRKVMAFSGGK